ncbi:Adhesion G protein-coupled receptor B1 [Takifugu flavidus]|uniref:Adhesion G protein-coupled receptor B1 n=1 Tax=Takifugu flavidus TaxID=433684 RepID=A0A5C6PLT1_9TELE|nr:Adhesion G protein-coupled receptor B1 [Takifugu flavidus]
MLCWSPQLPDGGISRRSHLMRITLSGTDAALLNLHVFQQLTFDTDETSTFVSGIVLYRNLGSVLALQRNNTVLNSKILSVTIKPSPVLLSAPVVIDFSHLYNGTTNQTCISWDESDR